MILEKDIFKVGFLGKTHALDGFINFHSDYDVLESNDYPFLILLLDGIYVPFCIEQYRLKSENISLVKFLDINNAETASKYQSVEVFFPIEYQSVVQKDNTSYWGQLINYKILNESNTMIGAITNVDEQTINILLELETLDQNTRIVPGVQEWIINIDHTNKQIVYSLPEGLMDNI